MKIATSTPFLLRPYLVSKLVDDAAPTALQEPSNSLVLGRALLKSAEAGTSVVIATDTDASTGAPHEIDYKRLAKGVVAIAGETLTGKVVAKTAWQLSSLSSNTTANELARTLVSNHVSPDKAKALAEHALSVLGDPVSRGILISISAGAATYIVVQRTSLSTGKKWAIILGVVALAGAVFTVLYQLKIGA